MSNGRWRLSPWEGLAMPYCDGRIQLDKDREAARQ